MTDRQRRWVFLPAMAGLAAFFVWGALGLSGFGRYPGPYGQAVLKVTQSQTNATGVVSAVNFFYRGIDTVGEEFILLAAVAGMTVVLRRLRGEREREREPVEEARMRRLPPDAGAVRSAALLLAGPVALTGWWLATHAQTSPSGGFQGGVVLATAFLLIYLGGEFIAFRRLSPVDLTDAAEALGAGGFAAVGLAAIPLGLPYLANYLSLGKVPGSVSSSGTIALISFLVGIGVAAAFIQIVAELLEQTLLVSLGGTTPRTPRGTPDRKAAISGMRRHAREPSG